MKKNYLKFISAIIVLMVGLVVSVAAAAEKSDANASGDTATKVKSAAKEKRYYEVMWAADAIFCEKVRSYADRERADYIPTNINFGNVTWTELDDYDRKAINVIFSEEKNFKTAFRWITRRSTGLEWDYTLDIFPALINFDDLAKDPSLFARKQEWRFEPEYIELTGLNGQKSPKPSKWCAKLKNPDRPDIGCKGKHPIWPFSFFDLIEVDGKTYITAATEQYQSPDDKNLPVVILVGRYIAPSPDKPQPAHGNNGTMSQLEHRCYLVKTK